MKRRMVVLLGGVVAATAMAPAANAALKAQVPGYVSVDTVSSRKVFRVMAWSKDQVYGKYTRSASTGTDRALYNKSGKGTIVQSGRGSAIVRVKACHPILGPDKCSGWHYPDR